MNDTLLEVAGLTKSYLSGQEKLVILDGLNLKVQKAQIVAITGASGAGKSTLLHLLGGMDRPDSGTILFDNCDLTRLDGRDLAVFRNREIGFVFQFHHLLPEFSALENVMIPLLLRKEEKAQARSRAAACLAEVGLEKRIHHRPGELSGGEQQRVALARALAGEPRLLLADEPTGNLDQHTSEAVFRLLLKIHAQRNLTSMLVTHNMQLASLCDVEFRLSEGKLS
ncbi:MAG: ABC transporter ATP-binding protein [Acidobacteria bacterium]|nr:ABC transporter ATP-binding protein [Acidobacteriota bacterium]